MRQIVANLDLDRRAERETFSRERARGRELRRDRMRVMVWGRGDGSAALLYGQRRSAWGEWGPGGWVGRCPLPACPVALGLWEGRGPGHSPGRPICRAMPLAEVTAQARPGASGRAGTSTITPGRAVPRAEPKPRVAGCMAKYK